MRACWEEPVREVHMQHRGCHGYEYGFQRGSECSGFSPDGLPGHGRDQHLRF